jgi:hypothetical protein
LGSFGPATGQLRRQAPKSLVSVVARSLRSGWHLLLATVFLTFAPSCTAFLQSVLLASVILATAFVIAFL